MMSLKGFDASGLFKNVTKSLRHGGDATAKLSAKRMAVGGLAAVGTVATAKSIFNQDQ